MGVEPRVILNQTPETEFDENVLVDAPAINQSNDVDGRTCTFNRSMQLLAAWSCGVDGMEVLDAIRT